MVHSKEKGFIYKTIGFYNSDYVKAFFWSGVGNIFVTVESDGSKDMLLFNMIV